MTAVIVSVHRESGRYESLDRFAIAPDVLAHSVAIWMIPRVQPRLSHRAQATRTPSVLVNRNSVDGFMASRPSVGLRDPMPSLHRRFVVVGVFLRTADHVDLLPSHALVGDLAEQVSDAVQPGAFLVVGSDDVPRSIRRIRGGEHHVPRVRVRVPAPPRLEIGRAEFPLPQGVVDARLEAPLLLLRTNLQPVLDEADPALDHLLLPQRTDVEEVAVLLLGAEAEDILDARAVVPAPVEDHDLSSRREVRQIPLDVHLGLLAIGRGGQRRDAEHARTDALGNRLDHSALAGGVAPFEHDDDPLAGRLDPVLHVAQLGLEAVQLLLVRLGLQRCPAVRAGAVIAVLLHSVLHAISFADPLTNSVGARGRRAVALTPAGAA